jgi:hypothetical protein
VRGLLLTQAAATLSLTGLVWFVQLVHYPLFAGVGVERFAEYELENVRRTTWIAAPLMGVEAVAAAVLLAHDPGLLTAAGAVLVALLWLSTFLVQVPLHRRLARGFDGGTHERLVTSNWARTTMWTGRAAIAIWLLT